MKYDLLLVVPAFEESRRLPACLEALAARLEDAPFRSAILVVDDGSGPAESAEMVAAIERIRQRHAHVRPPLVLPRNVGKGGAILAGWSNGPAAHWLGFVDADGSIPAGEVVRLMALATSSPGNSVFASRVRMLGRIVERRWIRHAIGRVFATMVGWLIHPGVYDSQCGCKIIPAAAWDAIRDLLTEERFAFDVELMAALLHRGFPIQEVPIDWRDTPGSKIHFFQDTWQMAAALRRIHATRARWPAAPPRTAHAPGQPAPRGAEAAGR